MKLLKYILLIMIIILCIIPIPNYVELNKLKIINKININCSNNMYKVVLYEVIPRKEDNSINYSYKKYYMNGNNLYNIKLLFDSKNLFYYGSINKIITNCSNIDEIKNTFLINRNVRVIIK